MNRAPPHSYLPGLDAFFAAPGTWAARRCQVCGALCDVRRDVLGPTSMVEALGRKAHLHDAFHCPNTGSAWHDLAREVFRQGSDLVDARSEADPANEVNTMLSHETHSKAPNALSSSNADRFLAAFRSIEDYLTRNVPDDNRNQRFTDKVKLLAKSDALVERYRVDLEQFAWLRNAISHQQRGGRVIAEPNDAAVHDLERIAAELWNPPRLLPKFRSEVLSLQADTSVERALEVMYNNRFSQLPIYRGASFAGLLTANTVLRWLGSRGARASDDLDTAVVGDLLSSREDNERFLFLAGSAPQQLALKHFHDHERQGLLLAAILITDNASVHEPLQGIITVYDLPRMVR